jgi:hypothetical protein
LRHPGQRRDDPEFPLRCRQLVAVAQGPVVARRRAEAVRGPGLCAGLAHKCAKSAHHRQTQMLTSPAQVADNCCFTGAFGASAAVRYELKLLARGLPEVLVTALSRHCRCDQSWYESACRYIWCSRPQSARRFGVACRATC